MLFFFQGISGTIRKGRIRNDYIRTSPGVADKRDKTKEYRLPWFDHVMRRDDQDLVGGIQGGRPKLTWELYGRI